jgi:hypothetical protein
MAFFNMSTRHLLVSCSFVVLLILIVNAFIFLDLGAPSAYLGHHKHLPVSILPPFTIHP